jgi:hypothetical protein
MSDSISCSFSVRLVAATIFSLRQILNYFSGNANSGMWAQYSSAGFQRIAAVAEVLDIKIQETHILLKS